MVGTLRFAHPAKPALVCRCPTPSLQAKRSNPSRRNGKAIFVTYRGRSASRWWARCALPTLRSPLACAVLPPRHCKRSEAIHLAVTERRSSQHSGVVRRVDGGHAALCPPYEATRSRGDHSPLIIPASIRRRLKRRASAPFLQA